MQIVIHNNPINQQPSQSNNDVYDNFITQDLENMIDEHCTQQINLTQELNELIDENKSPNTPPTGKDCTQHIDLTQELNELIDKNELPNTPPPCSSNTSDNNKNDSDDDDDDDIELNKQLDYLLHQNDPTV